MYFFVFSSNVRM